MSVTPEQGQLWRTELLAIRLMREHGLVNVRFKWDRARKRAGAWHRKTREISLSAPLMAIWPADQVRDTILHEIAHALTDSGHDAAWRAMAVKIGANPRATYTDPLDHE